MAQTQIRPREGGLSRLTFPAALVDALDARAVLESHPHVGFRVTHRDGTAGLDVAIGPQVDPDSVTSTTAYVRDRRVILEVPVAVDGLWNLGGCDVVWPAADDVARDGANATLSCGLRGWEPHFEPGVGVFDVVRETIYRTSVFEAGEEVYLSLPAGGCRAVGIDAGSTVGVGCAWVDGRAVLVLRPDGGGYETGVHASGPAGGSQVRIAAARVAGALGVGPDAVIRWVVSEGQLVGFPAE